jgi:hypothetical protein
MCGGDLNQANKVFIQTMGMLELTLPNRRLHHYPMEVGQLNRLNNYHQHH